MRKKKALIFGITGQDGFYLTELLLKKNYILHGVKRRSSSLNTQRLDSIYENKKFKKSFFLHYGDISDSLSVDNLINKIKPDEIYNLAAQSHVMVSFQLPEYTADVTALGTLRILESIRKISNRKKIKFYQAGSSEMFGSEPPPQSEKSRFLPMSPYAVSKTFSHHITKVYREAYKIFACNGILFNHESPLRGETFVTKKIIRGLIEIKKGKQSKLTLGNIYAERDWGHAKDYVKAMWLMMQKKKPDDYIISSDKKISVKTFINIASKKLSMDIKWKGTGLSEKGYLKNKVVIEVKSKYIRPAEVNSLKGDSKIARKKLNWKPAISLNDLIDDMIKNNGKVI